MHLALRVVYLRSLFLIIIVHIFSFYSDQREVAGDGSKSFFNFYCDGLSLHLKWCLICACALRLLNIELIWLLLEINLDFTICATSWTYEAPWSLQPHALNFFKKKILLFCFLSYKPNSQKQFLKFSHKREEASNRWLFFGPYFSSFFSYSAYSLLSSQAQGPFPEPTSPCFQLTPSHFLLFALYQLNKIHISESHFFFPSWGRSQLLDAYEFLWKQEGRVTGAAKTNAFCRGSPEFF